MLEVAALAAEFARHHANGLVFVVSDRMPYSRLQEREARRCLPQMPILILDESTETVPAVAHYPTLIEVREHQMRETRVPGFQSCAELRHRIGRGLAGPHR